MGYHFKNAFQLVFLFKISELVRILGILENLLSFFQKNLTFSKSLKVTYFFKFASQIFFLTVLKKFKNWSFLENYNFVKKLPVKSPHLASFIQKATQRVNLRKNSQNDRKLGFFRKVDQFFSKNNQTNFSKPLNVDYFI